MGRDKVADVLSTFPATRTGRPDVPRLRAVPGGAA